MVSHWFKQWKKYVGFDNWDKYQMGEQTVYPGPVDNSGLLRGEEDENPPLTFARAQKRAPFLHYAANGDKSKHCVLAPKSRPFGGGVVEPSSRPLFSTQCCPGVSKVHRLPASLSPLFFPPLLSPADGDVLAIKEHLIDELDYILVPTEGWNKLVSWYGLTEGQEPIARKVGLFTIRSAQRERRHYAGRRDFL